MATGLTAPEPDRAYDGDGTDPTLLSPGPPDLPDPPDPLVPERPPSLQSDRIGRYVVLSRLGAGGMGVVYSAFDETLARRVAVKLLFADRAEDEAAQRRLEREGQALARLSHPNVVQVYEVGEHEGNVFMAMEFVQGITLREWTEAEPRSWSEVVACYLQAARGLQAAHAAGLLHRDFKPDNALLGDDGRVRVLDFGLARLQDEGADPIPLDTSELTASGTSLDQPLTLTGALLGTPAYMAPEQFRGMQPEVRTDVFSFCASLYEALYGRRPHQGQTRYALLYAMMSGPRPPPSEVHVPARIERIIMQGLAPKPKDRPASMQEIIEVLEYVPRRRRWWVGTGLSLVLGSVVAILGASWLDDEDPQPCTGLEQRLEGVWDEAQRAQVEAAFAASGAAQAPEIWPKIASQLDRRADALVEAMHDACVATWETGEQSFERLDRRMSCLNTRTRAMRALVGQLAQADARTVINAQRAVEGLPDPTPCANPAVLDMALEPPPDEERARQIEDVRDRLAEGHARIDTGHALDAQDLSAGAIQRAEQIGYVPLQCEADMLGAMLAEHLGDYSKARSILLEVVDQAEAHRHDQVLANAWLQLVHLGVDMLDDAPEVDAWIRRAEATNFRAGDSVHRSIELAGYRAWLAAKRGEPDLAQQQIDRGLELRRQTADGRDETSLTTNFDNAQASLAGLRGDYPRAATILERQLEQARATYPEGHPSIAAHHYNLAWALQQSGRYDQAREHYTEADRLWARDQNQAHHRQGLARMGLGSVALFQGDLEAARRHLDEALAQISVRLGPTSIKMGEALNVRGMVAFNANDLDTAVSFYERALAIFEEIDPSAPRTADVMANLGEALRLQGKLEPARQMLEHAVALRHRTPSVFPLVQLGLVHLLSGRPEHAIDPLLHARRLCLDATPPECADITAALAIATWHRDRDEARRLAAWLEARPLDASARERRRALMTMLARYHEIIDALNLDGSDDDDKDKSKDKSKDKE